jgi:hypothetical protein
MKIKNLPFRYRLLRAFGNSPLLSAWKLVGWAYAGTTFVMPKHIRWARPRN